MTDALSTFFSAWAMSDADARRSAITASVADTGTYVDPRTPDPLIGPAALSDYVAMFAAAAPGARAEVAKLDERGGITRATIAFKMPNGAQQLGQYFVEHDMTGKISRMTGFVGTGDIE